MASEKADSHSLFHAVFALAVADEIDEAAAAASAALVDARARGSVGSASGWAGFLGFVAWFAGDVRECEAHARAWAESAPLTYPIGLPSAYTLLALALIERGALDEAEQALIDSGCGPDLPLISYMNFAFYARGLLRLAQQRHEEALADLLESGQRNARCHMRNPRIPWRCGAASALQRLGRDDEARPLVAEHMVEAHRWGTSSALGVAFHAQAMLASGEERIVLLERSVAALARSPARLDLARAHVDLGIALRRARKRTAARERLRVGWELAHQIGAVVLAEQAHDELVAIGAPPRRLMFSGVDALTASELRVARLAAEGMPNRDIAQALFITAKTVENHLGRVYAKLGINSRTQLRPALDSPIAP